MVFANFKYFLPVFFIFFFGSIFAQSESVSKNYLDSVVVTATLNPSTAVVLPMQINKLQQSSLQRVSFKTMPEALKLVPGVFVQHTNWGGGSPIIRGLMGNQILLLKDGIRLNNSTYRYGPNQYANTVDFFSIQAIEVLQGSGAVQYGSDAMGGVVHMFSDIASIDSNRHSLNIGYDGISRSHHMEQTYHTYLRYQKNHWALKGDFTHRKLGNLLGGGNIGYQNPSGYKESDYQFSFIWKPTMNAEWLLFSEKVTQNDVHVYHKVLLENYKDFRMELQQRALHYAKWKQKFRFGVLHTTISFQSTKEIRASQKNGSSLFRRETDKVGTLGVQMDLFLRPTSFLTMNSGVEFYNDLVQSNKIDKDLSNSQITYLRGLYPNQSKYRYASIYSLQHWNWKKIHLETGLRYSAYKIQIADTSLGKVILKPSALVSNAAVTFDLSSSDHLYLSLQNAFRAPNVDDMGTLGYVDNRYEIPAYDLKPERSVNYEVGYKYAVRSNAASVALYYANIRNLITRVLAPSIPNINSLPVYYKENTDHAYLKGITIQYNYTQQHWNITTNASYQLGQNLTRNEPMRRIPPLFGDVTIGHLRNKYAVYFQIAAASSQKRLAAGDISDNRIGKNGTEGWEVCNMNIHKKFKYISMSGGVQNIFNQQYKYHGSGIYGMGRSYFFQWQFNFKD